MLELPNPVLEYIRTLTVENRSPAYLLVEKNGRLSNWGGKLAVYGVTNLQKGEYVWEQVFFLEGLLPLDDSPMFLPCIKTNNALSADIHIFPGDKEDWVLLLDATLEENQRSLIQQKGNDLSLLRKKQSKILNQYFEDITDLAQDVLTLEVRGERRDVTILLADIRGFTSYSENNPPELVFKTLNLYLSTMIQPILNEGGIVDKIIGDAVMALFGILPSTASPPAQAIKAALRMIEAVKDIGKGRQLDNLAALDIGIGIASGPVALGIISSKNSKTLSAVGARVNLAVSLESQARSSEIIIDENTFNKIDNMREYFSTTTFSGKGTNLIQTYSYIAK